VVYNVVVHMVLDSSGASEVQKLGEQTFDWSTATDDMLGISELAALGVGRRRDPIQ
jgi:hypothetical protein